MKSLYIWKIPKNLRSKFDTETKPRCILRTGLGSYRAGICDQIKMDDVAGHWDEYEGHKLTTIGAGLIVAGLVVGRLSKAVV